MPMSYPPKLDAVFAGECRQTIRRGTKYEVGDEVLIYQWSGKPYKSKWLRQKQVTLLQVHPIHFTEDRVFLHGYPFVVRWGSNYMDYIAEKDYIDPPTGLGLKEVLKTLHKNKDWTGDYQILRW